VEIEEECADEEEQRGPEEQYAKSGAARALEHSKKPSDGTETNRPKEKTQEEVCGEKGAVKKQGAKDNEVAREVVLDVMLLAAIATCG
jgi:hypothetical protein